MKLLRLIVVPIIVAVLGGCNRSTDESPKADAPAKETVATDATMASAQMRDQNCVRQCQRRHRDKVSICDKLFNSPGSAHYHDTAWHRQCLANARSEFDACLAICGSGSFAVAIELLTPTLAASDDFKSEEPENQLAYIAPLDELAIICCGQGKYDQAEPACKRIVEINEQALGQDHFDTAHALQQYAQVLRELNRAEEAQQMDKRANAIFTKLETKESDK